MDKNTQLSKLMSYWLRHNPSDIGIILDDDGWTDFDTFVEKSEISEETIKQIVSDCKKQRFSIKDGKIRANQGHSVKLDMTFKTVIPPTLLYHGTTERFVDAIYQEGIKPMKRHHVHLSGDIKTALDVGKRHGDPAVLVIEAWKMHAAGIKFYISENGVYLVDAVDPKYIV